MSTTAAVIEPSLPDSPQERMCFGLSLRALGKNVWALSDQILISGANFAVGVLTARAMGDRQWEFGAFSVVYGVLLLCNIFQSTLITQAHNVLGATRTGRDYKRYTGSTAFEQLVLIGIEVLLAAPVVIIAYLMNWSSAAMIVALLPAIVGWQAMEFVRRVLYTEGRYRDAFLTDVMGYGGQTLLLAGLYYSTKHAGPRLTGATALYAIAISCGLAALLGVWQLRHSVERCASKEDIRENWHFGKWLLGGEMLGWASSLHMQVWWAAILIGTAASADLRAAQILFGPTRVISFFLGTILPIRFAQALHRAGPRELHRNIYGVYGMLIPVVGVYCLLLAIFPKPLLDLIYSGTYADTAAAVLRLYSLSAFLSYIQMVVAAALTASRQTHLIFTGSVVGCVIALILGPLCIWLFDAEGAIINIIVTTLVVTILYWIAYRKQLNKHLAEPIATNEQGSA